MDTDELHPETARRAAIIASADPAAESAGGLVIVEGGDANQFAALDDRGRWLFALLHNGEAMPARQMANMRRLVACWNACQGISTASLEALPAGTIAEELARLATAGEAGPADRDPIALATSYGGRFSQDDGTWFCVNPQGIGASGATKHEAARCFCEQFNL